MLLHLGHLEGGGVGGAILTLAQGLPLHHTVVDALNLPPLAVFLLTFAGVLPACAEQGAVNEIVVKDVVAQLPLAVTLAEPPRASQAEGASPCA